MPPVALDVKADMPAKPASLLMNKEQVEQNERKVTNDKFDELAKGLAQSGTRSLVLAGIVVLAFLVAVLDSSAQAYTTTDLGDLGGGQSGALSINNRGQVVGNPSASPLKNERDKICDDSGRLDSTVYYYEFHAFLWTPVTPNGTTGTMADLGALKGDNYSVARSVNGRFYRAVVQ